MQTSRHPSLCGWFAIHHGAGGVPQVEAGYGTLRMRGATLDEALSNLAILMRDAGYDAEADSLAAVRGTSRLTGAAPQMLDALIEAASVLPIASRLSATDMASIQRLLTTTIAAARGVAP